MSSQGRQLLSLWRRLSPLPGGRWLFSKSINWTVPYSGTVRPKILALAPGHARIAIADRRGVRNHLHSVHAVALANVAELASGLAMTTGLPDGIRGIVTSIRVDYVKKARGTIVAESNCIVPSPQMDEDHDFTAELTDAVGEVVARATVTWRLGPSRPR